MRFVVDKVATLLRLATLEDHIFLLSHVLRCPAGIASWAGGYVQPVPSVHCGGDASMSCGSVLLDHCVTMLAMVLQPIRSVLSSTCLGGPTLSMLSSGTNFRLTGKAVVSCAIK